MPTFLSPAVFVNEIDLSVLPAGATGIIPAFVGSAKRGPINTPQLVTNGQQFVDKFGTPFAESFLGYAVLAYLEEGNIAWVNRVGVECEEGQPVELSSICIDTSGNREHGWGRIPVFQGIDFGKIETREAGTNGFSFHDQESTFIEFVDAMLNEVTFGPTSATLTFTGSNYTGPIDDEFLVLITSPPSETGGSVMDGAEYTITRSSDGVEVKTGSVVESSTPGTSEDIEVADGVVIQIVVSAGKLDTNDNFRFSVRPDNRNFSFNVDNGDVSSVNTYTITGDYATATDLSNAINTLSGFSSEYYTSIATSDDTVRFQTEVAGKSIQLVSTEAFALEVGQSLYIYDIPRSNLIGIQPEPFDITSANNIVKIQVRSTTETKEFEATIPVGFGIPAATVASGINAAATVSGDTLVNAYPMLIPGGDTVLIIETTQSHQFDQIQMLANTSNIQTLRFAEEVGILSPYTEAYRGFYDSRVVLPEGGEVTEEVPLSCELYSQGQTQYAAQCLVDSAYYDNIVGWFVASSAGTWINGYKMDLSVYNSDTAQPGRYTVQITDPNDVEILRYDDVSFDPREDRYIGNLINPGAPLSTVSGDEYINWIQRPDFLGGDPSTTDFEVRNPASYFNREFDGQANGIPADAAYSSELDRAIIGNPAENSGIYAFADPEQFDISLLVTPGFSSGAVLATMLSICTQRGDCLALIDPPFGLDAQQVVNWHNGLLFTDLTAALNSSYGALYHPWVKIFDQFNGGYIYIPPSGHVSAVFSRTARVAETWFAPAGLNRGQLLTALDLEVKLTRGERDLMYGLGNAVNPIINIPQQGIYIWGQRTLQRRASALDRVNVRMLLIAIKKALAGPRGLLNNYLFEPNDTITRRAVVSNIDNYMADIAARRGVTGWKTICDETNNTPIRIDRNELWVSLLIKPTRAIEFIVLNIAILRTDQAFSSEEVLAQAGVVV